MILLKEFLVLYTFLIGIYTNIYEFYLEYNQRLNYGQRSVQKCIMRSKLKVTIGITFLYKFIIQYPQII